MGNILNKRKIINDPVHGFINIPNELVFDLIEHPYFQRLTRIKQLGLTYLVYPGAIHSRFQHCIGAMHLISEAITVLRAKGNLISVEEELAASIAILLHDIGHGPFSHALEHSIVNGVSHEEISDILMNKLNILFNNQLELAIQIFRNKYHKKFLHQLVSSQLDVDRLDYLKRDSFYTGVSEGVISTDRIIKMLNIVDDELVVEEKGIYSIEKFIVARRLMYWQVYLHKTVLSAEKLLVRILQRAKELAHDKVELFSTPALHYFLYNHIDSTHFSSSETTIEKFVQLDDFDIVASIKVWQNHSDSILSILCKMLIERKLFRIEMQNNIFDIKYISKLRQEAKKDLMLSDAEIDYFVFTDDISINAYNPDYDRIGMLLKNGNVKDFAEASDQLNIDVLAKTVKKYFVCYPKHKIKANVY
ncbi:MAG: HD domain-containing protein [Bacteroidota bacterium]